jgi:hypothetical protein
MGKMLSSKVRLRRRSNRRMPTVRPRNAPSASLPTSMDLYRGFSCPQEHLNEEFLELLTREHALDFVRRFVERFGEELEQQGRGLATLLLHGSERCGGFDGVWDLAFGEIRKALLPGNDPDFVRRAAGLGLRLHECGVPGEWELRLAYPVRLRWGQWLLPLAKEVAVCAQGDQVSLRLKRGVSVKHVIFSSTGEWQCSGAESLPEVRADRHRFVILCRKAVRTKEFQDLGPTLSDRNLAVVVSALESALSVLRAHASVYLPWVDRVVRCVIPIYAETSSLRSASGTGQPGVIQMSFRGQPAALAEMLVHEGTHQYMNLLCRLGDIDDGSDPTLYYSPVRRTGRPIRAIVVAYHAFGNVLLFYRLCRASGLVDDGYCLRNETALIPQLEKLEEALRKTRALTPLGRALWEPLADRIH